MSNGGGMICSDDIVCEHWGIDQEHLNKQWALVEMNMWDVLFNSEEVAKMAAPWTIE